MCGGFGCVRDRATESKELRLDDADGNPVLLVRQRHGGGQEAQDRTKGAFGGCLTLTLQPMWISFGEAVSSS